MPNHHPRASPESGSDLVDALYGAIVDSHPHADVTYATAILVISYMRECYATKRDPLPDTFASWKDFPSLFVGGETFMASVTDQQKREVHEACCRLYRQLKPIANAHRASQKQKGYDVGLLLGALRTHCAWDGGRVFRLVTQTDRFTGH